MQPPPSSLDPSSTIPPFLACLSTASATPKPPPAVLSLLSPILSQRVQILSESPSTTSWLPLLNWDNQEGTQLTRILESASLEPHPVSGEIEFESEPEPPKYRRIDEETLQALVSLPDVGLTVVYTWASSAEAQGWKISELKPLHGDWQRSLTPWVESIRAAQDAFEGRTHGPTIVRQGPDGNGKEGEGAEEDDGYWDRYDATPGRTPARTPPATVQHAQQAGAPTLRPSGNPVEDNYWGQYGSVQPALDAEDPDEKLDVEQMGQSTLNGCTITGGQQTLPAAPAEPAPSQRSMFTPNGSKNDGPEAQGLKRSMFTPNGSSTADSGVAFGLQAFLRTHASTFGNGAADFEHIAQPRPRSTSGHSSTSGKSALVEQLEGQVESQQSPRSGRKNSIVAEFAVQQHISTSLKSLFRLARGAGMQRSEFERIVQNELGVLDLLDEE